MGMREGSGVGVQGSGKRKAKGKGQKAKPTLEDEGGVGFACAEP